MLAIAFMATDHPSMLLQTLSILQVGTARVIWSFSVDDPSDSLGESAMFHNYEGSHSINLLGGLTSPPSQPADLQSFDLTISNVRDELTYLRHCCCSYVHAMVNINTLFRSLFLVLLPPIGVKALNYLRMSDLLPNT